MYQKGKHLKKKKSCFPSLTGVVCRTEEPMLASEAIGAVIGRNKKNKTIVS